MITRPRNETDNAYNARPRMSAGASPNGNLKRTTTFAYDESIPVRDWLTAGMPSESFKELCETD